MNQEDRYQTTSWDGGQVGRQAAGQGPGGQEPPRSGKKKRAGRSRSNPFLSFLLWIVIVVVSSAVLAGVGWMLANDLCALNKPEKTATIEITEDWITGTKEVEKSDGTTKEISTVDVKRVAKALKAEGLIEYDWFFQIFAKVIHADEKIGVGTFQLHTDMDYRALIYGMILSSKNAETVDVTIPEGYNVSQIIDLLAENGVNSAEELTEAAENYVFEGYAFVDNENLGSASRLEGYLFPDTYNFYVGGKPEVALRSMIDNFNNKIYADPEISQLLEDYEANSGYTFSDAVTIASLIEKETDGTDRDKISSVIYNRLANAGETNFLLQIDAALVYAAGRPVTQEDYTTLDSPYNLYQHQGLPPTPIANPGRSSILAALQPADTNYYFYVLGGDGKHIFSATLAEHNAAQAQAGN